MSKERFIKRPTKQHLESIFSWCPTYEAERIQWHCGHKDRGVLALFDDQQAIAYLYYRELSKAKVEISFIEVKEIHKKKGVGTHFVQHAFHYFMEKGYKLVNIHCVTEAGASHARRLGFQEYTPENYSKDWRNETDSYMFYSLLPSVRLKEYHKSEVLSFVVWSENPSGCGTPDLCYDIPSVEVPPLVDFLYYDWYVGLMKDGELIKPQEKVKYTFRNGVDDIYGEYASYLSADEILKSIK